MIKSDGFSGEKVVRTLNAVAKITIINPPGGFTNIQSSVAVQKMQLWASQIDDKYFDTLDKKLLLGFSKECETFVYLLQMMYHRDIQMLGNPLLRAFKKQLDGASMVNLLGEYAAGKDAKDLDAFWRDEKQIIAKTEERLKDFISTLKPHEYSEKEIIEFYENISLRRNVWLSLFSCQKMMETLDFKVLERSRF